MGGVGVVSDGSLFSRCKYNIVIMYIMCHCMTDMCVCERLRGAGAVVMVARSLTVTMCIFFFMSVTDIVTGGVFVLEQ